MEIIYGAIWPAEVLMCQKINYIHILIFQDYKHLNQAVWDNFLSFLKIFFFVIVTHDPPLSLSLLTVLSNTDLTSHPAVSVGLSHVSQNLIILKLMLISDDGVKYTLSTADEKKKKKSNFWL